MHHAGHLTRIPRHPKSLSCTTLAIRLASQDTQKVCRAPRWPSNSHPKTPKKSVVHHAGHQTRIPRQPKSLSCTTLAIKLASQDTQKSRSCTTLAIKRTSQDIQKVCRAPRWLSNSHPKTPKKSVVHHAGHQTRIPRHPKSLSCITLAIKLVSQDSQKVCRAPRWPSNSHHKTAKKSVMNHAGHQIRIPRHPKIVHHAGHQTRIPRHPKSLSCTTLAIKLAPQDTQKVCLAPRWSSNSHPKTPKKSVVHHAGHQTCIPRHPKSLSCTTLAIKLTSQDTKKSVVHHAGHQARIPTDLCTTLAIKLASQDTQKVCRAPRWPSNSHPKTPKKSVVHHTCHPTRIPRHPKSLSCTTLAIKLTSQDTKKSVVHHAGHQARIPTDLCTTLAIKLASQDTQKVCRAPRWPSNSHPKTPKKSVVHHAGHQTRIPRHPKSLSCITLAIKLVSQDSQKVCRAPRWPSNSHHKTAKKSVMNHAGHQIRIPRHPKIVHHAGHQTRIPRLPKSLSCTTLAIKLAPQDTQKVCLAPRWSSNSHPKTPKKSVVHHAGHQTCIPRHPKSLSCTTLAIKLTSQDTKKSVVHHAGHQARIPTDLCTTLAIKLASQDTQKVCRAPRWPSNSHPKTPKKSVVHHAGHQTRIPRHPKSWPINLTSQDAQKVCRAPRWPSNSHPKTPKKSVVHHTGHQTRIPRHPKSLSCTILAIKLASHAPCWPSNSHPKTPKMSVVHHAGHQTRIPRHPKSLSQNSHPKTPKNLSCTTLGHQTRIPRQPKSLSCTTLAFIQLASQDTEKARWPSNSHRKTPKKSVVQHAGHQTRIPRHPKCLLGTTLAIKLASQITQKVCRAAGWPSNLHPKTPKKFVVHPKTPKKSVVHHAGHQTRIPTHPKSLSCTTLAIKLASQDT